VQQRNKKHIQFRRAVDSGPRGIVAQWLEDTIGLIVEEVGHPNLKRWAFLRSQHVKPPRYDPA